MDNYVNNGTSPKCLLCSMAITSCVVCIDGATPVCVFCNYGYYLSPSGFCDPCLSNCLTCTSAMDCTTCAPTFIISGGGMCVCEPPLFLDVVSGTCMPCNVLVLGCLSCAYPTAMNPFSPDPPVCVICDTTGYFVSSMPANTCVC